MKSKQRENDFISLHFCSGKVIDQSTKKDEYHNVGVLNKETCTKTKTMFANHQDSLYL